MALVQIMAMLNNAVLIQGEAGANNVVTELFWKNDLDQQARFMMQLPSGRVVFDSFIPPHTSGGSGLLLSQDRFNLNQPLTYQLGWSSTSAPARTI